MEPSQRDAWVRRDTAKVTAGLNKRYTLEAAEDWPFDKPRCSPGRPRTASSSSPRGAPRGVDPRRTDRDDPDAKTFVSLDQPERLAEVITAFIEETSKAPAAAGGR